MKLKFFFAALFAVSLLSISAAAQTETKSQPKTTSETTQTETKKRPPIFRATKDQITQAQKMMKEKSLYTGEETGKMNDDFRAALRKYQDAEKIKATGTLNKITLEKMGIALTDKQKAM